ncbi:MAG: hypothetical protein H7A09_01865 [Oceanospirillaceae bacterium]|nr:hypothetical protein [Oceanospirillaceae bacterium]MCP5334567.1 hypothetical protein [Oceanospirillaceae bacterium]MCP5351399.1 hypothetical protein [Oceanospirillaceae bacterium]
MKRLALLLFATALNISGTAFADDRDIYFSTDATSSSETRPNILFVIDNSGSMGGNVDTAPSYDNGTTYTGSYNTSYWYYKSNNNWYYFDKSKLSCSSISSTMASTGQYIGRIKQSGGSYSCSTSNRDSKYELGTGSYVNWLTGVYLPGQKTRLEIVKESFTQVLNALSDVNVGLMIFDTVGNTHGGAITMPMGKIEVVRATAINLVNNLDAETYTPLSETLYEAGLYFRGEAPYFGSGSVKENGNTYSTLKSVSTSISGGKYISPITQDCQKSNLILFTDGDPTKDLEANAWIKTKYDALRAAKPNLTIPSGLGNCSSSSSDGTCLDELTFYLKNADQSSSLSGDQTVTSYMIGGFMGDSEAAFLRAAATAGGGKYYAADDTQQLVNALATIVLDILSTDTTFTAPAVSVNAFNSFTHRDELFYALFRPMENIRWPGNLKKYKLTTDGMVIGQGGNESVIDSGTGFFTQSAMDFWNNTSEPDGSKVEYGGAANLITTPANRKIYYNTGTSSLAPLTQLTDYALLNVPTTDTTLFNQVKNWALGYDSKDENGNNSTTDARYSIGDPLHSEPKILTYGGTQAIPIASIFFGDNEGYLHAIDSVSGEEVFAFIPQDLLKNQKIYFNNVGTISDKPYGMDGLLSLLVNDANANNMIAPAGTVESGEYAYLYAGMRRGGKNYYALDVSNRTTPRLMFTIEGGKGDYTKLGQTWAKAIPAKVKWGSDTRDVLFIAGGYDDSRDALDTWAKDNTGNAIYMADAKTGQRLWWASNSGADLNISSMVNSIPASVVPIDINGDGNIDYMFAADTGGHVFRIDVNQTNSGAADFAQGTLFANLGGDTSSAGGQSGAENNRRFYTKPSVSFMRDRVTGDYLTISLGSGFRSSPRSSTVQDNFYVLRDRSPLRKPTTYPEPIVHINGTNGDDTFVNIGLPANQLNNVTDVTAKNTLRSKLVAAKGWYLPMKQINGEKVIADATTFSGAIIFNSFSKSGRTTTSCAPDSGYSKVYAIDMVFGTAAMDLNGDGNVDINDLSKELTHSGIAPRPVVIFREGGKKSIAIGTETFDDTRFDDNKTNDGNECFGPSCKDPNKPKQALQLNYWRENAQ